MLFILCLRTGYNKITIIFKSFPTFLFPSTGEFSVLLVSMFKDHFLVFFDNDCPPFTFYLLDWLLLKMPCAMLGTIGVPPTKKLAMLKYHTMKTQPDQMQLNSFSTFWIPMLTCPSISKPCCTITSSAF